ncbi:MAG TPA: 50S ribosomal protein L1 [Phycisphaerales bacterium]|nr:50S ribosomal protein L1 [Phycisphaerales bacterium]HRQ75153.1 50S ribosomal protein L1 [Phycisphaerales bacterium]
MPKLTKRSKANAEIAKKAQGPQPIPDAVKLLKSFKAPKFDQSVEVCVHLGIDPRQAEQQLRGSIAMPKGVGKTARVICFCQSDKAEAAKKAGAIEAGADDLVAKVEAGWMDFDVAVASPDMMRVVSKLGRVLGPKGLMPSPKAGTVTADVVNAVKEYAAGKLEYRNDDGGNVHCLIGKMSFSEADLVENLEHFIAVINKVKPSSAKGTYIKKCVISGTMTPGVYVAV